ncbi:hypothetical protein BU15DRAFT_73161 [Melanogaster broomeanus]|nr:hypothetical protein BU15DRAFT_73161 [Melanogaster broomeanus]
MRQASRSYPRSLSPSSSYQQLPSPATPRTPSYTTCNSPVLTPPELNSSLTTPTKRTPLTSTATCTPRQRLCTPSNKLTPPSYAQPTLAMSILAPVPRRPRPSPSPHRATPTPSISRPPSSSERLLRDTLRKDDTLRTTATVRARSHSRSAPSDCDMDDDEFFQSAVLFRCTSRRNSAASSTSPPRPRGSGGLALGLGHQRSFYVPDENEHTSYTQLLRSSSGSSRSRRTDRRTSQSFSLAQEKQEDLARSYDAAPHEAVLRTRLDRVIDRGMREIRREKEREAGSSSIESPASSPPSSLCSLSNSRSPSHESEQTQLTVPEVDACLPSTPPPSTKTVLGNRHRHSQSMSAVQRQVTYSPPQKSTPPSQAHPQRSPQIPRSPPQSPRSQHQQNQKHTRPVSPWLSSPLPPSPPPPPFVTTPSRRAVGVAGAAANYSPTICEIVPTCSHRPDSPHPRSFDPEAASLVCRQLPGYVSFASVAGLGAPPEEEERRGGRTGLAGFSLGGGGNGRGLAGLGGGKWWVF